ncbi:unnamed protein product [Amoebophrya sp. A120]|nr:unnamed protein product [Amoebophrya sp. A120]|eukprot:GSA120T00025596001.1
MKVHESTTSLSLVSCHAEFRILIHSYLGTSFGCVCMTLTVISPNCTAFLDY